MQGRAISRRAALIAGLGVAAAGGVAADGYGLVEAGTLPGSYHDTAFWARHLPSALEFLGGFQPAASAI